MSNKPVVPIFRAYNHEYEQYVYLPEDGSIELKQDHEKNFEFDHGPYINIEMSLDGTKFYTMDDVKELISLGEKYDRINSRGGRITYPWICCECQKETCICEKNYDQ